MNNKTVTYRKLTSAQRRQMLEWIVEGLSIVEMRDRASQLDEPFEVTRGQVVHARKSMRAKWSAKWAEQEKALLEDGFARKAVRIRQITEMYERHLQLIAARAEAPQLQDVPGGRTGLLTQDVKQGKIVFKYDRAVISEMRGLLDDIAREKGERQQKVEHSGPDGGSIPVTITDLIEKVYGDSSQTIEPGGEGVSGSGS